MSGRLIDSSLLAEMFRHFESCHPDEGCGLLLASGAQPDRPLRFRICRNAQDDLHALDTRAHPRTSRNAYAIGPRELLEIHRELRERDETIFAICHSHPDAKVCFSDEDHAQAVADGSPLHPGTLQIVVSVINGHAICFGVFSWDAKSGTFQEMPGG